MNIDSGSKDIFGYKLHYCAQCLADHQDSAGNDSPSPLRFAIRAEDKNNEPIGYEKNAPPVRCWHHIDLEKRKKILQNVLQRLKGIAESGPDDVSNHSPIKLLVGIEFDRFIIDSHRHLQKLRLHIPDAILVQVSLKNVEANSAVLSGATLYQCDLNGAAFQGGFFRKANLIDTCAQCVDMQKTCLEGALIACSNFERSMFERSDLTKILVIASVFHKSNLGYSNFSDSNILKVCEPDSLDSILNSLWENRNYGEKEFKSGEIGDILPLLLNPIDNIRQENRDNNTIFENSSFSSADLSDVSFNGINLSDSNFNDADLSGANFSTCILSNSSFRRAQIRKNSKEHTSVFKNCKAQNCDFSSASLDFCKFNGQGSPDSSLMGCSFDMASLSHAEFIGKKSLMLDMRRVNLNNCNLESSTFSFVNLDGADMTGGISLNNVVFTAFGDESCDTKKGEFIGSLKGVNLQGADMDKSTFPKCDFSGALMQGISAIKSDFSGAQLPGASLVGSDLRGIKLINANCKAANFEAATFTDENDELKAIFQNSDLSGATLTDCDLRWLTFSGTRLKKCKMNGVDLTNASFKASIESDIETTLESAELANSDLTRATLKGIILNFANLSYATLDNADMQECEADRVLFNAASMKGVNLHGAHVEGADFTAVDMSPAGDSKPSKLSNIKASNANFRFASLDAALLNGGDFINASFEGANLKYATLDHATISDAILKNSSLDCASLMNCSAERAVFQGASMKGVNLQSSHIELSDCESTVFSPIKINSQLVRSDLSNVIAIGSTFRASSLDGAKLAGGDFTGASFNSADLQDSDLTNTVLRSCDLGSATFARAHVDRVKMLSCHADFCDMSNLKQNHRPIRDEDKPLYKQWTSCPSPDNEKRDCLINCDRVCMTNSSFSDSNFNNSKLQLTNFLGSNLIGSTFVSAELSAANFENANLTNATLSSSKSEYKSRDSSWSKALLNNAILNNTHLDEDNIVELVEKNIGEVYGGKLEAIRNVWRGLKVNLSSLGMYDHASSAYIAERKAQLNYYKKNSYPLTTNSLMILIATTVLLPGIQYLLGLFFFADHKFWSISDIKIAVYYLLLLVAIVFFVFLIEYVYIKKYDKEA